MVDEKRDEKQPEPQDEKSAQAGVLQDQVVTMVSTLERSLASTCEIISNKMKELEKKLDHMEERYSELAKETEECLKESQTSS